MEVPVVWMLFAVVAVAGGRWDDVDPDVVVTREVSRTPAEVLAVFADLRATSELLSEDCARRWAWGVETAGEGARARVTWTPSWVNRRLTVFVREVVPDDRVVWEAEGPKGFETWFEVAPTDTGTVVTVEVPLTAPGWPLKKIFHQQIQPAWGACWEEALRLVDAPTQP